nr:HPr family phosphocarrier protein [Conyzicola lurida]
MADAAVALALDMAGGTPPRVAVAAGAGGGVFGTDAVAVAAAIDEVAGPDGVLVFMDLGSAVLSAGMALEFTTTDAPVRLSTAPFVEGVVAGIVLAAAGASLDEADREAAGAMTAKNAQLAGPGAAPAAASLPTTGAVEVTLVNPLGLHARPAAAIVAALAEVDATVTVSTGSAPGVSAKSLMGLMSLGAQQGAVLRIEASGADAAVAVETIRAMAEAGFGEV